MFFSREPLQLILSLDFLLTKKFASSQVGAFYGLDSCSQGTSLIVPGNWSGETHLTCEYPGILDCRKRSKSARSRHSSLRFPTGGIVVSFVTFEPACLPCHHGLYSLTVSLKEISLSLGSFLWEAVVIGRRTVTGTNTDITPQDRLGDREDPSFVESCSHQNGSIVVVMEHRAREQTHRNTIQPRGNSSMMGRRQPFNC